MEGEQRGRISRFIESDDFFKVEIELAAEPEFNDAQSLAQIRAVTEAFDDYAKINKGISKELQNSVSTTTDPAKLADTLAAQFSFKLEDKQRLMETVGLEERLSLLLSLIRMEIEVYEMDQRIKGRVRDQMEKTQKNYYLNEQMRAIKKEDGHRRRGR